MRFYFRFQAFSSSRTLKPKKSDKESPCGRQHSSELLGRLAMLEEQVRMMGNQLNKVNWVEELKLCDIINWYFVTNYTLTFIVILQERQQREELEQKVEKLQVENEQLLSERKVAGEQLQKFYKKFFESINAIPTHLMHKGLSTSSLSRSTTSMRRSGVSINSLTSQ